MNKNKKDYLFIKLLVLIIIVIIIDVFLFRILFNLTNTYLTYLLSLMVVFINAYLFGYVFFIIKSLRQRKQLRIPLVEVVHEMKVNLPLSYVEDEIVEVDETTYKEEVEEELSLLFDEIGDVIRNLHLTHKVDDEVSNENNIQLDEEETNSDLQEEIIVQEDEVKNESEIIDEVEKDILTDDVPVELEQITDAFEVIPVFNEDAIENVEINETEEEYEEVDDYLLDENSIIDKPNDLDDYLNNLSNYIANNGIQISKNNLRELFSAMAASRLVVLKHESVKIAEKTIELFLDYIGANNCTNVIEEEQQDFISLLQDKYSLTELIYVAENNRNSINVMNLKNVDLTDFDNRYYPINEYAINPLLPVFYDNGIDEEKKQLPKNIWFTMIMSLKDTQKYSKRLSQGVITIELDSKRMKPVELTPINHVRLSFDIINEILIEGYENYFMDEEFWKGIDEIEDYLNQVIPFKIDNRLFRQLERYSSTFLIFGGENVDVIDSLMNSKLINIILLLDLSKIKEQKVDLISIFEKNYGLENLPKTKIILKELQLHYKLLYSKE